MAANYATHTFNTEVAGKSITIRAGATRDTVSDAALIAMFPSDFTATAPVAGVGDITGIMAGWLAVYPRGEVH